MQYNKCLFDKLKPEFFTQIFLENELGFVH